MAWKWSVDGCVFDCFRCFCFVVFVFFVFSVYTFLFYHVGVMLVLFWYNFGVIVVSLGVFWRPWAWCPPNRQGGKSSRESSLWVLRGSSPGTFFWFQIVNKLSKSRCENHIDKHCAKSVAQEVSGTPSNHESCGFASTKPLFLKFHLYLQNDRKYFPMGTPLAPIGMPWAASWLFGRVLGTGWNFHRFGDPPWAPPGQREWGGGRLNVFLGALISDPKSPAGWSQDCHLTDLIGY